MKAVWMMSCAAWLALGCTPTSPAQDRPASSATSAAASQSAAAAGVPELIPGVGIGPVKIGMTRADLDKLGMPVEPGPLGSDWSVGPYTASMDGDRVGAVYVELMKLPSGAKVGGTVFDGTAKIEVIAKKLQGCGPMEITEGANVITCEGGRALVLAGGPPGIVALHAISAERAAKRAAERAPEAVWKHPGMDMSFRYPAGFLAVQHKPDGASLESEILGTIEDRSGKGKDRPSPLSITISVRVGGLLDVMKSDGLQVGTMFPGGTEASFKEDKGFSERVTVAGKQGYSLVTGSHAEQRRMVFAELKPSSTLAIVCSYVGDTATPKVPMATQAQACEKVVSTLAIKL